MPKKILKRPVSNKFPSSTTSQRRAFAYDLVMKNPSMTNYAVISQVEKKFGVTMHRDDITKIRQGNLTLSPDHEVLAVPINGRVGRLRGGKKKAKASRARQLSMNLAAASAASLATTDAVETPKMTAQPILEQLRLAGAKKVTYPDGMVVEF